MTTPQQRELQALTAKLRIGAISRREFIARATALMAAGATIGAPGLARAQASEPKRGGFARFGLQNGSQNDSLDPATWATSFTGTAFNGSLCNNLMELMPDGSVVGDLAESVEPADNATKWVFKLRKGVTFHNGKDLTSEDVRLSLMHHMGEGSSSGALAITKQFASVEADGPDTVIITLNDGSADLPYLLTDYHLSVFPANASGDGIDWASGVGTGAFTLDSFEPGIAVRMERNPNYHKNNKPYFDGFELINIPDATARLNALLTGEVHMIGDIDVRNEPLVARNKNLRIERVPSLRHFTFDMDTSVAPFDDPNVRMALKYAMDRDDIIDKVFLGDGKKGNDTPCAEIMEFFAETPPIHEYNIDKAKELLAASGLDEVTVDLSVAETAFPGAVEAAVLFQEHAAPAGIKVNVIREANDGYWENVWLKKPFNGCDWFGRATMDWLFTTAYTSDAPWNNTHWSNAKFDELQKSARLETDHDARAEKYAEMQQLIHDDGGVLSVAFVNWRYAMTSDIGTGQIGGLLPCDNMRMTERWWMTT
ncbi:MAG: peptide ABC transporter substrate-binding protein [Rhodobacteraceae bacterium]|nr:peptide ABC transporter substrate-binding protein [Paracoccaceae bacterium]